MKTYKTLEHFIRRAKQLDGQFNIENKLWTKEGVKIEGFIYRPVRFGSLASYASDYILFRNDRSKREVELVCDIPVYENGIPQSPFTYKSIYFI